MRGKVGSGAKDFKQVARDDSDAPWRLLGGAPVRWGVCPHLRSPVSTVQKTALDSSRITAVNQDSVRFRWTERQSGKEQITKRGGEEFLRRFLQHVLPRGLMRVRHFDWLSPAASRSPEEGLRQTAGKKRPRRGEGGGGDRINERYARARGLLRAGEAVLMRPDKPEICCPGCGCAMKFLHALRPRAPPPPQASSFACLP